MKPAVWLVSLRLLRVWRRRVPVLLLNIFCSAQVVLAQNPDAVCARCHHQIYDRYQRTPMARASGNAADGLLPGEFTHSISGVHYRLFLKDGRAWLSYSRPDAAPDRKLEGQQELSYYVGSGNRGRTYLFQRDGFWFESPVNWYAKKQLWDMAPSYRQVREMPLTMPVGPDCLHCHVSQVKASLPGSRNHFAGPPFLQTGITCESCHGDPTNHLAHDGKGPILNPAKLDPTRRDSICLQCHLEGETSVARLGHSMGSFQPGDDLFEQVVYFVRNRESGGAERAASQWEALLQSACKRKSGDRLTCTTCHDPHDSPAPEQRVAFYRMKCLNCHNQPRFATAHHPDNPDCASCHMPRKDAIDVAHEQVTDHRIQRRSSAKLDSVTPSAGQTIVAVGGMHANEREFGLAYAQMAAHGDQAALGPAMRFLQSAERSEGELSSDSDLHTELGFVEQSQGNYKEAAREYQAALQANGMDSIAAGDLAVLEFQSRHFTSAEQLWKTVFDHDPTQIAAGLDLAIAQCALGDTSSTRATLERLLAFSPDSAKGREMLRSIASHPCAAR